VLIYIDCALPRPFWPNVQCLSNGIWTSSNTITVVFPDAINTIAPVIHDGNLIIETNITIASSLVINGALYINNTSLLTLNYTTTLLPLIQACSVSLQGGNLSLLNTSSSDVVLFKLSPSCINPTFDGNFSNVVVNGIPVACYSIYLSAFDVIFSGQCPMLSAATSNTLSNEAILGISICGSIFLLVVIVTVIILTVPSIRKKAFPFRDRAHFNIKY